MAQILYSIDEYIVKERKQDTYWLVFNTVYNDVHAFKKSLQRDENDISRYLKEEFTNNEARKEFLSFMKVNFPQTKIIKVFDLVNAGYLIYPYLGSIAIDCEKDDEVFTVLSQKYGNPYNDAITNNAVFWVLDYENAQKFYNERKDAWESELE